MTVFKFNIYHLDNNGNPIDIDDRQERYVLAHDEDDACSKLEAHRRKMVSEGYANFIALNPTVELENVIG